MTIEVACIQCGNAFSVSPYRRETAKFCSYACRGKWRSENWLGDRHPNWTGGKRVKTCEQCGNEFRQRKNQPITTFKVQKYCSQECAWKAQDVSGANNPNWRGGVAKSRGRQHGRWVDAVIARDNAQCQHCGIKGVEMHAHHIKPYKEYPSLRYELDNGITLCYQCHWNEHSAASTANGVNSGNPKRESGGNPEPSHGGNIVEGVTTNGRVFRRVMADCAWCGKRISRKPSDTVGRKNLFCSKYCSGKHTAAHRTYRPMKSAHDSNSDTSALPERDDIV